MKLKIRASGVPGLALLVFVLIAAGLVQSEEEKGRELVDRYCVSCHALDGWVHSKEDWASIVPDMASRGGELPSDGDTATMVDFLASHYGTGEAAPAAESPSASDDSKGQKMLEQVCLPCHEAGGWMRSRDEWEVIAPDHAARGGVTLSEADMKVLVDYLTKHYGP